MAINVLLRGGRVVDGTGNPWRYADVAITGEHILDVVHPGSIDVSRASTVVDAHDMVICPGFIDIQSHSITPLMVDGRCLSKITQGVTTEIMGEAWTPAPFGGHIAEPIPHGPHDHRLGEWKQRAHMWRRFGDWLTAMEGKVSPNIGSYLGAGTLREYVMGMHMARATSDEQLAMHTLMLQAMDDGAFGVSYALIYPPDAYADTEEIVQVCRLVASRGGSYITHLRSEGDTLLEAVEEAIEIGRRTGVPVEIYHLKAVGRPNWDKMPAVIERINEARSMGIDVTADMYPYAASGTGLASILPPWVAADGKFYDNLRDAEVRARIRHEALNPSGDWEAMATQTGAEGIMPVGFEKPEHAAYAGLRLSEIGELRHQHWLDAAMDLLLAEEQRIFTIYFSMREENLEQQLQQPWIKISTDAGGMDPAWAAERGRVHPRAYGTYPRVLGTYVRDKQTLTLEDAVRKMSGAVADRLSLRQRGLLRAGYFADVVMFDPTTVGDHATFAEPHQLSTGIRDVWVNGVCVLAAGTHTGAFPGHVVRGSGSRR